MIEGGASAAKLRSIQILRGLAALGVVLCHANPALPIGAAGVDLFFVVSGFIMGTLAPGKDWRPFMRDRLWRIFPLYWLALLPWLFLAAFAGLMNADRLAASLTLWPIVDGWQRLYLNIGWTLSFELLFYAALTFWLATGALRLPIILYFALLAIGLILPVPLIEFLGSPLILEFLTGLVIARLPTPRPAPLLLVPALLLLALSPAPALKDVQLAAGSWPLLDRAFWWGIPAGLIVYVVLGWEGRAKSPLVQPLVKLGDASYSLYLFHLAALLFLGELHWVAATALTVVIALGIHQWIERPLLRIKARNTASKT